jgi:anti-anti-sigma factor
MNDEPTGFDAAADVRDDAVYIVVRGEMDISNADRLATCFDEACAAGRPAIVFDLSGVTYCDSSALHVLTRAVERCEPLGLSMSVVGARGTVRRVFEITDTIDAFNIKDD